MIKEMKLTRDEVRTVYTIIDELSKMDYSKVNTFLGSLTIKEMYLLRMRIRYADYCERNHITLEDMTDADFEEAMMEEAREEEYEL